jgi:CheY-like chemotaxis protein
MMNGGEMKDRRGRERILVFDHEPLILDFIVTVLGKEGYRVTATASDEEVLELLCSDGYDLAIADLGLTRWNGQQLVRNIRQMTPDIPILAMSAYPEKEIIRFAEQHAEAFLTKPFCVIELVAAVRRVMKSRHARETGDRRKVASRESALVAVGSS